MGTYTASNNALCRRGSGHTRLHTYVRSCTHTLYTNTHTHTRVGTGLDHPNCCNAGAKYAYVCFTLINYLISSTELGSLTKSQLLEKVKELQGIAYQLGLEEG